MKTFEAPSEKFVEDILFDLLENGTLEEWEKAGLGFITDIIDEHLYQTKVYRQVQLGKYGIADLLLIVNEDIFTFDEDGNPFDNFSRTTAIVFELKKDKLTADNFEQVCRYKSILQDYDGFDDVIPVLIGSGMSNAHYLANHIRHHLAVFYYSFNRNGLIFKRDRGTWSESGAEFDFDAFETKYPCTDDSKPYKQRIKQKLLPQSTEDTPF